MILLDNHKTKHYAIKCDKPRMIKAWCNCGFYSYFEINGKKWI